MKWSRRYDGPFNHVTYTKQRDEAELTRRAQIEGLKPKPEEVEECEHLASSWDEDGSRVLCMLCGIEGTVVWDGETIDAMIEKDVL